MDRGESARQLEILETILDAMESGEVDLEELLATHPGETTTVRKLFDAARRYSEAVPNPPDDRLPRGTVLGDFVVERPLGKGGMGEVYLARQRSLGDRVVALKVPRAGAASGATRGRFQREARLLSTLHHPSLVEVYGYGEEAGGLFYAMRYVRGRSLADLLLEASRSGQAARAEDGRRIVGWCLDVARALALLHGNGLIHRDVKPSNIVLDEVNGQAVLVDFGLVRDLAAEPVTLSGSAPATSAYSPPEQLLGKVTDPRADVFSLGVTLHDLLTGRLPSERPQASLGLEPLSRTRASSDRNLEAVVARATDPEARWRYPDAAALGADLEAWLEGRPVSARRPRPLERAHRWTQENARHLVRLGTWVLGISLLLAAAIGLAGQWEAARDARRGLSRGDPSAAFVASRAVHPLARRVLVGPRLASLTDAWARIPELAAGMRSGSPDESLGAAATHLRVNGLEDDPSLVALLVLALGSTEEGAPSARAVAALHWTARLFHERPDVSPSAVAASAPLREALGRLWASESLSAEDRRFVLTAWGGCGTPAEMDLLLTFLESCGDFSEEQRLGLDAAVRVARRSFRCKNSGDLDLERGWSLVSSLVERVVPECRPEWIASYWTFGEYELRHFYVVGNLRGLQEFLDLACLERGSTPIPQVLAAWSVPEVVAILPPRYGYLLRASTRDPSLWPEILASNELDPFDFGRYSAFYEDEAMIERLRASARDRDGPAGVEDFEKGLEFGRIEVRGETEPGFELDTDTLLGAQVADTSYTVLPCKREATGSVPRSLARWSFGLEACELSAGALSASTRGCFQEAKEQFSGFLRLSPGRSSVRLTFRLETPARTTVRVRVSHLAAVRNSLPHQGECYVDVLLDGKQVAMTCIPNANRSDHDVARVPSSFLFSGAHVLELRSDPASTTTYRIFSVALLETGDHEGAEN